MGLAVGLEADGYLLTAGHVLDTNTFVVGWFDGRFGVKTARVVFKSKPGTHSDFALIAVDEKVDHYASIGERPKSGDWAFAVSCYRKKRSLEKGLTGGTVLDVGKDLSGHSLDPIKTDLPLWCGDSGGPLLSSSGQLIGINISTTFTWRKHWSLSFFPDKEFVRKLIVEDRAWKMLNKSPEPATAHLQVNEKPGP